MNDFATEILKRYGFPAIVFSLVGASAIWGLAHFVAAPGSQVSILWGLVTYTKNGPAVGAPSAISHPVVTAPAPPIASMPSLDLYVHPNVSGANVEKELTAIRATKNLRELTAAESGRATRDIPSGTYFYLLGVWLRTYDSPSLQEASLSFAVSRYRTSENYAEIHYPRGEKPQLVVFLDQASAQKVARLSGVSQHEVTAALSPWGDANVLVVVPLDRIVRSRTRDVELDKQRKFSAIDMVLQ